MRPDIVITGAGVASAVGTGCEALAQALVAGRDGLRPVERFDVSELAEGEPRVAGLWPAWDRTAPEDCTAHALALTAAREAWASARVDAAGLAPERIAVIVGTCFGERYAGFGALAARLGEALGARGPCTTVSTACSSSTTAVGLARDLVEEGAADLVLAGGVDVMTRQVFAGFHAIGAMGLGKCAPFGDAPGMTVGEGAGFVVVEASERAKARGIAPWTRVLGYGLSADAHHETAPDPSGSGVVRAARAALEDAGVEAAAIDFVSAHGTGTDANDAAEWRAIRTALPHRPPLSSTKSYLGHAQGAAGVLELVALLLCAQRGVVPPTLRAKARRDGEAPDAADLPDAVPHQPGAPLRALPVRHALKLSAAFGGANAALVIGRDARERTATPTRAVRIVGLSAITPLGVDLTALHAARREGRPLHGRAAPRDLAALVRAAPPRSLDPSGTLATAGVALALADARLTVRGPQRDRSGLFTGNTRMPAWSAHTTTTSVDQRGLARIAAGPFTHMVLNAPAGTATKLLSLKGPLLVLSAGAASGLLAIVRAAQHLATHRSADLLVAGGLDELPVEDPAGHAEGAAFVALTTEPHAGGLTLESWAVAGAGALPDAIARATRGVRELDGMCTATAAPALGPLDPARLPLGLIDLHPLVAGAEASGAALALVLAADSIRRGDARRLLVVAADHALSCAAVLARDPGASS